MLFDVTIKMSCKPLVKKLYTEKIVNVTTTTGRKIKKHTYEWEGVVGRPFDEVVRLLNERHEPRLFIVKFVSDERIENEIDGKTGNVFINVDKCNRVIVAPRYTLRLD